MMLRSRFAGLRTFLTVWTGQVASLIGSGLTDFALGLWVYKTTGSITLFALISLFATLPQVLISPLAGVLADRWDRRKTMMVSNIAAMVITLLSIILYYNGQLGTGYIYFAVLAISTCSTVLRPAFGSSTVMLVPKEQLGRANGLVQSGLATVQVIAPILAGLLIALIDIGGILIIDFFSYVIALGSLLLVRFPEQKRAESSARRSIWSDLLFGWHYLAARSGLMALLGFMAAINVIFGISTVLLTPLVLSMASTVALGTILSSAGLGMIAGSMVLTIWGGPKRRIDGVLIFSLINALFILLIGVQTQPVLVGVATFGAFFCQPILGGCINVILQSRVDPSVQGRVFGTIIMIALSTQPLAYFIAGPLSDQVFKPLLVADGPLASTVGQIIGVGPERGIGLFFVILGLLGGLIVLVSALYPRLYRIESELPDMTPSSTSVQPTEQVQSTPVS